MAEKYYKFDADRMKVPKHFIDFFKSHEITPEQVPCLFGGREEMVEWIETHTGIRDAQFLVQGILDRFGIKWHPMAVVAKMYQYNKNNMYVIDTEKVIPRPQPTKAERIQAIKDKLDRGELDLDKVEELGK